MFPNIIFTLAYAAEWLVLL